MSLLEWQRKFVIVFSSAVLGKLHFTQNKVDSERHCVEASLCACDALGLVLTVLKFKKFEETDWQETISGPCGLT